MSRTNRLIGDNIGVDGSPALSLTRSLRRFDRLDQSSGVGFSGPATRSCHVAQAGLLSLLPRSPLALSPPARPRRINISPHRPHYCCLSYALSTRGRRACSGLMVWAGPSRGYSSSPGIPWRVPWGQVLRSEGAGVDHRARGRAGEGGQGRPRGASEEGRYVPACAAVEQAVRNIAGGGDEGPTEELRGACAKVFRSSSKTVGGSCERGLGRVGMGISGCFCWRFWNACRRCDR